MIIRTLLAAAAILAAFALAPDAKTPVACPDSRGPIRSIAYCGQFTVPGGGGGGGGGGAVDDRIACGFWVTPSGGNDSNPGTSALPFATLGRIQTVIRTAPAASKVACLKAGTYAAASLTMTSADSGETWETDPASPVNSAIVDGNNSIATAVTAGSATNITFNAIRFQHYTTYIFPGGNSATGWTVKNSDLGSGGSSGACGVGCSFVVGAAAGWKISHNYVHDWQDGGITFWAFQAGDSADGAVIDGNVVLNVCTVESDCGSIYGDYRNTGTLGGHVTISNNFVRDCGSSANQTACHDLYLDDDTSNVTATGNILGPPVSGNVNGNNTIIFTNGGQSNTFSNNIIDIGLSNTVPAMGGGPCGTGGTIICTNAISPDAYSKNIVLADFDSTFTPNIFGNGGAFMYTEYYCGAATSTGQLPGNQPPSAWITVANSMYKNYGIGNMPTNGGSSTCGSLVSDASPQLKDPLCSGYLYALASTSPAFTAIGFADVSIARKAGPPSFVIPTSTNTSCGSGTGLPTVPSLVEGYWYWGFPTDNGLTSPSIATMSTNAPVAQYAAWFSAIGTGAGDGHLTFSGVSTPSASAIAAWKASGKIMGLTIGGSASNVGQPNALLLTNGTQEANMLADIKSAVTNFGFQGIDIDMENDAGQWTAAEMCTLFSDLKSFYGSRFVIDIDPAPYQLRSGGSYLSIWTTCGSNIDLVSPQWYSQAGQTDSFFINSFIGPDLNTFINTDGIPSTKILIGAADNNGDDGAPGGPATYCTAYKNWLSANPSKPLRGFKWFQSASDQQESPAWNYASTIRTCLGL